MGDVRLNMIAEACSSLFPSRLSPFGPSLRLIIFFPSPLFTAKAYGLIIFFPPLQFFTAVTLYLEKTRPSFLQLSSIFLFLRCSVGETLNFSREMPQLLIATEGSRHRMKTWYLPLLVYYSNDWNTFIRFAFELLKGEEAGVGKLTRHATFLFNPPCPVILPGVHFTAIY